MIREIPTLTITLLKTIAKAPVQYIDSKSIERALKIFPEICKEKVAQLLVDYISEAGRMTDDVQILFPITSMNISVRNSKLSGKYVVNNIAVKCQNLIDLDVSGCFQVMDETIFQILSNCTYLEILNYRNCRKVTDISLDHVCSYGKSLISLNAGGNFNITGGGLKRFLISHRTLDKFKDLHLSGLPLTEEHISLITRRCNRIVGLSIANMNISEVLLKNSINTLKLRLEKLCIGWTTINNNGDQLSNSFFDFLANSCPCLIELDVSELRLLPVSVIQDMIDIKIYN